MVKVVLILCVEFAEPSKRACCRRLSRRCGYADTSGMKLNQAKKDIYCAKFYNDTWQTGTARSEALWCSGYHFGL